MGKAASSTRSRNVSLLFANAFLGGFMFYLPVLALYYERALGSSAGVAIVFAVEAAAQVLFEVPTGAIADLFGRKKSLVMQVALTLCAMGFLWAGGGMAAFLAYAIIGAFARSLGSGTDAAMLYDTLKARGEEDRYAKAMGIYSSLWPLGAAIGSIAGGYLAKISLRATVAWTALPFAVCLVLTLFLQEAPYEKAERRSLLGHMAQAARTILGTRQLVLICLALFLMMAFGEPVHLMSALFFKAKLLPVESYGWIGAASSGLSSLGFFVSHDLAKRLGRKRALVVVTLASPLIGLGATFLAGLPLALAWVSTSLCFGIKNPILSDLMNREIESAERATVLSMGSFAGQLGVALAAPLVFGLFTARHDIVDAVRLSEILLLTAPALLLFLKKG